MKANRLTAIGLVAGAALWIASGHLMPRDSANSEAAIRPIEAKTQPRFRVEVKAAKVVDHSPKLTLSGRTEADHKVDMAARTAGVLTQLNVKRGQHVQKGDVVAVLSDEAREAQVAQAQALFDQRKAELEAKRLLIEKGASYERCARSPLQDLAEIDACPNFQAASAEIRNAIVYLADNDPRSVRHDVFRMLSCRNARAAGLEKVLVGWLDRGKLQPGTLSFSPLEALDPDVLVTRFGRELEVAGHLPSAALDHYDGSLPSGFEEALRTSHWAALEW